MRACSDDNTYFHFRDENTRVNFDLSFPGDSRELPEGFKFELSTHLNSMFKLYKNISSLKIVNA